MDFKVGLVQLSFEDHILTKDDVEIKIADLAGKGVELIVMPELHNSYYFCQEENPENFNLAEKIPGPSTEFYADICQKHQIVLVISLFEKRSQAVHHNTCVVIDKNGEICGKYRKMHIPDDPGYYEKYYFTPGDQGFKPIQTSLGNIGVLVCWDQWFPEAARLMTLSGADILIYPTAIGWEPNDDHVEKERQLEAWKTIQKSHAIANGVYVISANRTGFEPDPSGNLSGINFWGHSFIADPFGKVIAECSSAPSSIFATIDQNELKQTRRTWPFLRDRRIDHYDDLNKLQID